MSLLYAPNEKGILDCFVLRLTSDFLRGYFY